MSFEALLCLVAVGLFAAPPMAAASNCSRTSVGFTPLIDMETSQQYLGEDGLLYPGSNVPPPGHFADAVAIANTIGPLDSAGNPSPSGKIVWFSCGMSNTNGKSNSLLPMTEADPLKAPEVQFVNGANGGIPVEDMVSIAATYWVDIVPQKLVAGGVTAEQVQVVWLLQTHRSPSGPFGTWYLNLRDDLGHVCRNLYDTFPNLKIIYLSPRSYAGYADGTLNPEPYAYQSGFSVKKLIDDQLSGDSTLTYSGPSQQTAILYWSEYLYIWADGVNPTSTGLSYVCSDYNSEGTHPSGQGYDKIAAYMLNFYQTDPTCVWYRFSGSLPTASSSPAASTTSASSCGGDQCFSKASKSACEGDCECARCYGSGAQDPMKGCVPACRQSECEGSWDPFSSPCLDPPTTSQPPSPTTSSTTQTPVPTTSTTQTPVPTTSTTQTPVPATTTTTTQGAPGSSTYTFNCAQYNGNPSGCQGACMCGHCSPCGCTQRAWDGSGPLDGCTCNGGSPGSSGAWKDYGPC